MDLKMWTLKSKKELEEQGHRKEEMLAFFSKLSSFCIEQQHQSIRNVSMSVVIASHHDMCTADVETNHIRAFPCGASIAFHEGLHSVHQVLPHLTHRWMGGANSHPYWNYHFASLNHSSNASSFFLHWRKS